MVRHRRLVSGELVGLADYCLIIDLIISLGAVAC
jgi:hypothetical protein